jgi:hypothetical protein
VEKHGTARQATDDNITKCMCIACWITKSTNTHSAYVVIIAFPLQPLQAEIHNKKYPVKRVHSTAVTNIKQIHVKKEPFVKTRASS